jgi:hypothetical protein
MGRWWVGLALLGVASCARQTEFIGRVQGDGAATDATRPGVDAGAPGDAPEEPPAATCLSASTTLPEVPQPVWTCGRERCLKEGSVDPALFAPGALVDAEPERRPRIEYPLGGSIHPVNLSQITLQWQRGGPGQTAFRITVAPAGGGETPFELFVPYAEPLGATRALERDASYAVPEGVWRYIARTYAGREVRLRITGHDPVRGISTSDETAIQFSPAAVEGGLYYLETINRRIQRHVFGAAKVEAMVRPFTERNLSDCGGCHSLSRNGKTLAFSATYAGNLTIADTSDLDRPTFAPPPAPEARADAVSPVVSPDGSFILARDGIKGDLTVYSAAGVARGGATAAETGGRIDFPEWSPDGREIVATRASLVGQPDEQYSANSGQLVVMRFTAASLPSPLSAPEILLDEPDQVHAYPSWSPDGQWIVFVSSPVASGQSHNNPSARLRLVARHPSGQPKVTELGRATLGGAGSRSTFPKFAPTGQRGCQLLFVTFNSRMDYGLLRRNRDAPEGGFEQLWMSAIDLSRLSTGEDPSAPPVWLPFQDINQRNVAATWSEVVPCASDPGCGAGARCRAGRCVAGD